MYKIRINCTDPEQLTLDNLPITDQIQEEQIINHIQPDNLDYVVNIIILYRTFFWRDQNGKRHHKTTLEFLCKEYITECKFKDFIKHLNNNGFYSKHDTNIEFVCLAKRKNTITGKEEPTTCIIHNYGFNSQKPKKFSTNIKRKKNKSKYSTKVLYTTK